jgi:tetratricopeptide (TPR) repeat protein
MGTIPRMSPDFSDLMSDLPEAPLSAAAIAYQKDILSVPYTEKPMAVGQPEGIDQDEVDKLHDLALKSPKRAVRPLLDCIGRFPNYPTLRNYLMVAYQRMGQNRKANEVLKQLVEDHPDYHFGRYSLAMKELEGGHTDRAEEAIGKGLDIRAAYPGRDRFHVSEMRSFYTVVAFIHARRGEVEAARGVLAAIKVFDPHKDAARIVQREIVAANLKILAARADVDQRRRIAVRLAELPKRSATDGPPDFEHELIACLYEHDIDIPVEKIREILALPRESLVEDLGKVFDDCVDRSPDFMEFEEASWNTSAVLHALHLLAEVDGTEALPGLLRVLSMHPDAVDFWLGETSAYSPQISRLVGGGIPECAAWLKLPGIDPRHKGMLCEGLEYLARQDAGRRDEVAAAMKEVLAFLLDSPPEDNVLDTAFLALLISCLIEIRAEDAVSLIETAYDMNLVQEGFVGDLASVKDDISRPLNPAGKPTDIVTEYLYWQNGGGAQTPEDEPENLIGSPFGAQAWSPSGAELAPAPQPGRNDPCPCGSGKKYKKCCLR